MGYPRSGIDSHRMQPTATETLKIETPHALVHVYTGKTDDKGRDSMIVEVSPDGEGRGNVPAWGRVREASKKGLRYDVYRLKNMPKPRKVA